MFPPRPSACGLQGALSQGGWANAALELPQPRCAASRNTPAAPATSLPHRWTCTRTAPSPLWRLCPRSWATASSACASSCPAPPPSCCRSSGERRLRRQLTFGREAALDVQVLTARCGLEVGGPTHLGCLCVNAQQQQRPTRQQATNGLPRPLPSAATRAWTLRHTPTRRTAAPCSSTCWATWPSPCSSWAASSSSPAARCARLGGPAGWS